MKVKCNRCGGIGWVRGFGSIRETCPCQLKEENHDAEQQAFNGKENDGQRKPPKQAAKRSKQNIRQSQGNEPEHESRVG